MWSILPAVETYSNSGKITEVTVIIFWWLQGRVCLFVWTLQPITTSDLWKCLNEQTQREEKRWKAKLHWRSLFRTSNREHFSQQSAGLQGDRVVISWQRGAGHVGTTQLTSKAPDLEDADCTHTLSTSWSQTAPSVFFSVALRTHFSYLLSAPSLSSSHLQYSQITGSGTLSSQPTDTFRKRQKVLKVKKGFSFESVLKVKCVLE